MPNYQNGKIYKIVNTEGTLTYIGSTCQTLAMRKAKHHNNFKRWKNDKNHFVTSFKVFDDDEEGCQIVLLENFPCDSKIELEKRERHYIETMKCVNKCRPTRSDKEYYKDNKEEILENTKRYREVNKDKINQNKKMKHKCVCGGKYTASHTTRHFKSLKHVNYINSVKSQQNELEILEAEFDNI
jgi:hypothetical protein